MRMVMVARRRVDAIEAHYVVAFVLNPHAAHEAVVSFQIVWNYVHYNAAHFTQKFPPDIGELIVRSIELRLIHKDHLGESAREILPRHRVLHVERNAFETGWHRYERVVAYSLGDIQLA